MEFTDNNQIRRNLILNILSLASNIGIGLLYTPYLVHSLGIAAYGIIPLALIINQYIGVVTDSLTSSLSRFYSIALQQNKMDEASKYLSTSIIVILGIIITLAFPLYSVVANIERIFTIPIELIRSAKLLFSFTILSFFCSLIGSTFNITLYAYNRLDLLNIIKIIRVIGKLLFVFLLFTTLDKDIIYVGIANLTTEIIILIVSLIIFLKFTKGVVKLNLNNFDKIALKSVSLLAFWVMVQQLGDMGLYRIDNVLVNMFWSSKESGILGAFTELGSYTMTIAAVVGSLFGPLILIAYSKNDHKKVKEITLDRSLSVGLMVAVMVGIIGGFSPIILQIWIGNEFVSYNAWLMIKLALIPFYSAAGIFSFAARSWNKVRFPALVTLCLGIINFVVLYYIATLSNGDLSYVNVMLIIALVFGVIQSYFLGGLYFATLYKGTTKIVLVNFFKILTVMVLVGAMGYILTPFLSTLKAYISLLCIFILSLSSLVISLKVFLSKEQLKALLSIINFKKNIE